MSPTITAFERSPDRGKGLARDMRVRWALEEVGQPYNVRLVSFREMKQPAHLALQPFGQIPTYQEGDLEMFETGAIIFHIAERRPGLFPEDANARARAVMWMFAALNTIEPPITVLNVIDLQPGGAPEGAKDLRAAVLGMIEKRLDALSAFLGDREHLVEDRFTAADLLMTTVLRILRTTDLVEKRPALAAYRTRGEARPAFRKALAAQLAPFAANAPPATAPKA